MVFLDSYSVSFVPSLSALRSLILERLFAELRGEVAEFRRAEFTSCSVSFVPSVSALRSLLWEGYSLGFAELGLKMLKVLPLF
ncbi:hypothetical protein C4F49_05835 [Sphingobacterium sp. KB22]|uniref:Uncharacterized protein n=1 Tax=Sphingobacterium hungaricum TaxID=2082723 RepID=A0A928UWE5_9SPHI|nr:hypothetical protein [Sphingobacterium hungaricum]